MNEEIKELICKIFEGKEINLTDQSIKNTINDNLSLYELETRKISSHYFETWAENLLHLINETLFDSTAYYFSIFTTAIDIIPSFFPADSQIFLYIVQVFLINIIKNEELMNNFYQSFCFKIQKLINSQHFDRKSEFQSIDLVLKILKSFHITDALCEVIYQYNYNFTQDIEYDPAKQTVEYAKSAFSRYFSAQQIFTLILNDETKRNDSFITNILHTIFNQLITSKMHSMTVSVSPPLGRLLSTPLMSWILDEYEMQYKSQQEEIEANANAMNRYKFKVSQLYESCGSFIYNEILEFTRENSVDAGDVLFLVENLSLHYKECFEKYSGAMNFLESSIREAINNSRLKFGYNFACFLDARLEDAFNSGESFWKLLISPPEGQKSDTQNEKPHCGCGCGCNEYKIENDENLAKSALLRAVMRIENKNKFCEYLAGSVNSLASVYGEEIINDVIRPVFEIIQLATDFNILSLSSKGITFSDLHHQHSCCHHHHDGKCEHEHHHENNNSHEHDDHHQESEHEHHHENNHNENDKCDHSNEHDDHQNEKCEHEHHHENNHNENDKCEHSNEHENDNQNSNSNNNDGAEAPICDASMSKYMNIEACFKLGGKETPIFCDYLTFQILQAILESSGGMTLDEIERVVPGNPEDIENRVFTLSDYLLYLGDDDKYVFDESFTPEGDFLRIPPFYEETKGEMEPERQKLARQKIFAAIQTKGSEKLDFFLYDCFLMLNRKLRPDRAMILDILDKLIEERIVTLENETVSLVKAKEEEEEEKKEDEEND